MLLDLECQNSLQPLLMGPTLTTVPTHAPRREEGKPVAVSVHAFLGAEIVLRQQCCCLHATYLCTVTRHEGN